MSRAPSGRPSSSDLLGAAGGRRGLLLRACAVLEALLLLAIVAAGITVMIR